MLRSLIISNTVLLMLSSAFSGAAAQVMGLNMGESISSIKSKGVKLAPASRKYMYNATNLPRPAQVVPEVLLTIHPRFGLCTLSAGSVTHDDNSFGSQTRSIFEKVKTSLASKYGEPTDSFDFVRAGSMWNAEQYFMMGLEKKERSLVSYWQKSKGSALPQNVQIIVLTAKALSSSSGYVTVKYEASFHDQCVDAISASESAGL